ncbi:MAG: LCP family protein [Butyricicoccus sp.]
MSKKKQFEYYDEFGQPVDRYGRAINPETGRPYEEEGDSAGQGTNHRTVRRQPPAPERASARRPGKRNTRGERTPVKHKKRGRKRRMSLLKKILLVLALIVALMVADVYYLLTLYEYDDTNASSLAANTEDGMMNIALFGVDTRENNGESGTRADAIMIMNVNPAEKSVKLVSLMRDSYVDVPGYGSTKLCHAYGYGGPQLMMQTLNENFDLHITEYMVVDFAQMASIIDAVGGVTVTLTEEELAETNKYICEYCWENGVPADVIEEAGEQKLDGVQAMTYGRIRKGNTGGDWQRTERQSVVLNQVFSRATSNPVRLLRFLHGLMPNIKSSMSKIDFVYMGLRTIVHGFPSMGHLRLPLDGEWQYGTRDGMSVIEFSNEALSAHLRNYFYHGIDPTAKNAE